MTEELTSMPVVEASESIELTRNSKGFNWVLKIRTRGEERLDENMIKRMEALNMQMAQRFGSNE